MWFRVANTAVGIWLMAAPAVLGYGPPAADFHRIIGPTAAAFAIIAIAEVTRPLRWVNLPLGAALVIGALFIGNEAATYTGVVSGLAMMALSVPRGRRDHAVGGGWKALVGR